MVSITKNQCYNLFIFGAKIQRFQKYKSGNMNLKFSPPIFEKFWITGFRNGVAHSVWAGNRQMWGPDHFWIALLPPGEQKGQRLQAVHQVLLGLWSQT